jgi:hypothetical protein
MKLKTSRPNESGMKFFTPELYLASNSDDEEEAARAHEMWEQRIVEYRKCLQNLLPVMPVTVQRLSQLCLHDADILSLEKNSLLSPPSLVFPFFGPVAILTARQGESVTDLFYFLWDNISISPESEVWPFSRIRPHWLYDEIDSPSESPGLFWHRILISDGSTVEIPFINALVHHYTLSPDTISESGSELLARS